MDTVEEENSSHYSESHAFLQPPEIVVTNPDNIIQTRSHDADGTFHDHSALSSRRPSAIIAALRRPSQTIALSAAHAVMNQRRYLLSFFQGQSERSMSLDGNPDMEKEEKQKKFNKKLSKDVLTTILSALYAKLVIVLGMAFPITETISRDVPPFYYQGFYLYMYLGSIAFVGYMYVTLIREKAVFSILNSYQKHTKSTAAERRRVSIFQNGNQPPERYGSFYLRLGAIAFGIGSMVYSGLEFGRYFELKSNDQCYSNVLLAITPATRMVLTLVQVQFIFLNSKDIKLNRHKFVARFGLMHMIATNLCEWLYVLVQETRHEIIHLDGIKNNTTSELMHGVQHCHEGRVMGSLVAKASPFLFPCTIEYSLICAVILYEMWKKVKTITPEPSEKKDPKHRRFSLNNDKNHQNYIKNIFDRPPTHSNHHITVDCSNAHRGLFAGILVIVLTIISLIMFFVLNNEGGTSEQQKSYRKHADFEVNVVELILYVISTFSILITMYKMKDLKYDRKTGSEDTGIGLDNTLLLVAQTGMFIYCMFSIIGCYFTLKTNSPVGITADVFSLIQTCLQTMFVLDGWWRRCRNLEQTKRKPGRETITFLIITNMAMWIINITEKNRAEFRPSHLAFYGDWAWTIITHISMPLAIFYRFHSTICLFEIWKSAYKIKGLYAKHPLLPYLQSQAK